MKSRLAFGSRDFIADSAVMDDPMATLIVEIRRLFSGDAEVREACIAIAEFIASQPSNKTLHLTFSSLQHVSRAKSNRALLGAIQYLTGSRADLLDMKYEFADEDGEFHSVPDDVVAAAMTERKFFHPITGSILDNFEDSLLVYFDASSSARRALMAERLV